MITVYFTTDGRRSMLKDGHSFSATDDGKLHVFDKDMKQIGLYNEWVGVENEEVELAMADTDRELSLT